MFEYFIRKIQKLFWIEEVFSYKTIVLFCLVWFGLVLWHVDYLIPHPFYTY